MGGIVVSDAVERILTYLERSDEMSPYLGGKNKAHQAKQLVVEIRQLVDRAEELIEAETHEADVLGILKRLKPIVYDMEDVLDEVGMSIREDKCIPGGKLTKLLCTMTSKPGRIITKRQLATQLKVCIGELGDILNEGYLIFGNNIHMFSQQENHVVTKHQRPLHVFHPAAGWDTIIGRDEDKQAVIHMLLSDSDHPDVSVDERRVFDVVSIVGMGGVGKTTLAMLVYDDSTVAGHFNLIFWVFAGQSADSMLSKEILESMINSTGVDLYGLTLELLMQRLQDIIIGKRFLLVVDDVWNENGDSWSPLLYALRDAKQGSKILVTTRSKLVANILGSHLYCLGTLSDKKAWLLFKRYAFTERQKMDRFTEIGEKIVELSQGVPLVIKTIASTLWGKSLMEWRKVLHDFQGTKFQTRHGIWSVLKLSYIHLPQQLKKCFAYCSLFPEDYEYNKSDLIYLWKAQGFITPLNGSHQTIEEAGNEYIMSLVSTCFFQDAAKDENGEVISFRMHGLIREMAIKVAFEDNIFVAENSLNIPDSIVHASFLIGSKWEIPSWLLHAKKLRSLLLFPAYSAVPITIPDMDRLFSSLRRLRVFVLDKADCKNLPDSIRHLKHLKYLKLGGSLESLPPSITRLPNLQTLDLRSCDQYVKFPKGVTRIDGVTVLCNLQHFKFVVDEDKGLKELVSSLDKPVGKLEINFKTRFAKSSETRYASLKNKHVTDMVLEWSSSYGEPDSEDAEDKLLQQLEPSPSLETLVVRFWKGMKFTDWGILNLASIEIEGCSKCQELPPFNKLPYLRCLYLLNLKSLEYVENSYDCNGDSSASYFISLDSLKLEELPKLKGWCTVKGNAENQPQLSFPCLSNLTIYLCPKLMSLPQAPKLQTCSLEEIPAQLAEQFTLLVPSPLENFLELQIVSIFQLESLSINHSPRKCLRIKRCEKLVDLILTSPIFQQLEICGCFKLRNISGGLQHVEELKIWLCEELNMWVNTDNDHLSVAHGATSSSSVRSLDWEGLKCLRHLTIGSISKLKSLPKGFNYLTTLQELKVFQLCNLRGLPKWIGGLTQLRLLEIVECPMMRKLFDIQSNEPDFFKIHLESLTIKVERCRELVMLFEGNPVSFQGLEVHRCAKLNSISSAEVEIKELVVNCCGELHLWEDDQGGPKVVAAWQGLKSVNTLTLNRISRLVSSPKGLRYLTLLQQLEIFQLQIEVLQLQIHYLTLLHRLEIVDCSKLKTMSLAPDIDAGEELGAWVHRKHLLKFFRIDKCPELLSMTIVYGITVENCELRHCHSMKEISGKELVIQKLVVENCNELDLWNDQAVLNADISSVLPAACQVFNSIQSLTLSNISKLETLPRGLQSSEALKDLEIIKLSNLRTLPEWVNHFTQLQRLDIRECSKLAALPPSLGVLTEVRRLLIRGCSPELKSRCQQNGEDWSYIQHIPEVIVA